MYFIYLIRSSFKDWCYVGFTKNLESRSAEHNKGYVSSTKFYKPFDLLFVQLVEDTKKARELEKFLKINFNKEVLLNLIT